LHTAGPSCSHTAGPACWPTVRQASPAQPTTRTAPAPAPASLGQGPIELRDEWLLAQSRLSLPATSPDTLAPGWTRLSVDGDWGNDFGWRQDVRGEEPIDRRFLVDGEHATLAVSARWGISPSADVGLRLPVHWRGGGILDGVIDTVHAHTAALGVRDNARPRFERNRLRVLGRGSDGAPVVWTGDAGLGLGNLELSGRLGLTGVGRPWRTAVVGRASLPTGTGTFRASGLDLGAQLVAAHQVGRSADVHLGAGATYYSSTERQGIGYPAWRSHGFAAVEWRPSARWGLLVQTDASSRLVTNLAEYPGIQWYLRLAVRRSAGEGWSLHAGFSENIMHQQATVDFAVFFGLSRQLSR
jgi:hypothetical protein